MKKSWLLTIACLDDNDTPKKILFSDSDYVSSVIKIYPNRIKQIATLNIAPNDGGVFKIFSSSSIGEIELYNNDGELDYLADYALDGREVTLTFIDDQAIETVYLTATISKISERSGDIILTLKAFSECLDAPIALSEYAGTGDLEGGDNIKNKQKPMAFGYVQNITPVLVNESKLIYQAASGSNCRIVAVYDDGVKMINYQTSASVSVGASSISVDSGVGGIASGSVLAIKTSGKDEIRLYTTTSSLADGSSGSVSITPVLSADCADNTPVEIVNGYADTTALLATAPDAQSCWDGYQGYFRLAVNPAGVITCDVVTVDGSLNVRKAFDVLEDITGHIDSLDIALTIDQSQKTVINGFGDCGLYVDDSKPIRYLLDAVIRSVGGFYWFAGTELQLALLAMPSTPVFTIKESQILSIARVQTGLGSNGVPIQGFEISYDKIETVQTTLAGSVSKAQRNRLAKTYRTITRIISATKTRNPLAETIKIESLLRNRTKAGEVADALNAVSQSRCDVVDVVVNFSMLPAFAINDTITVVHRRYGYSAGRDMWIAGYQVDKKRKQITLRLVG